MKTRAKSKVSKSRKAVLKRSPKVELRKKEPRTVQKTVRVPNNILEWLEGKCAAVSGDKKPSVPAAIVQILENVRASEAAKKSAAST